MQTMIDEYNKKHKIDYFKDFNKMMDHIAKESDVKHQAFTSFVDLKQTELFAKCQEMEPGPKIGECNYQQGAKLDTIVKKYREKHGMSTFTEEDEEDEEDWEIDMV